METGREVDPGCVWGGQMEKYMTVQDWPLSMDWLSCLEPL